MCGKRIITFLIILVLLSMTSVSVWKYIINTDNESAPSSDKVSEKKSGNALDIEDTIDRYNEAKKNAFHVETQSIYKQIAIDIINDSLLSSGPFKYCSPGPDVNNIVYDATNCKPLNINTSVGYYIETDNSYNVKLLVVYNDLYYITIKNISNVNDIKEDDIKENRNLENKIYVSKGK